MTRTEATGFLRGRAEPILLDNRGRSTPMTITYLPNADANAPHRVGRRAWLDRMFSAVMLAVRKMMSERSQPEWHTLNEHLLRDIGRSGIDATIARDQHLK